MPSGGARARSGPPPDPNALNRERDRRPWTRLPARREGPPPPWPLSKASRRETQLWAQEWQRPQATEWERLGMSEEVATYVRCLVRAERPDSGPSSWTPVLRLQGSLGLTVDGMHRNLWTIGEQTEAPAQPRAVGQSARERLRGIEVIDGGGA